MKAGNRHRTVNIDGREMGVCVGGRAGETEEDGGGCFWNAVILRLLEGDSLVLCFENIEQHSEDYISIYRLGNPSRRFLPTVGGP